MQWFRREPQPLPVVVVSTKSGQLLRGVLVSVHRDALIMRAVTIATVERNQQTRYAPLDGDVVVPTDNIDFYQTGLDASILEREVM